MALPIVSPCATVCDSWTTADSTLVFGHPAFTVHGLRRTFNDLTRRAGADGVVPRSLTGHVTEGMTEHLQHGRAGREEGGGRRCDSVGIASGNWGPNWGRGGKRKRPAGGATL